MSDLWVYKKSSGRLNSAPYYATIGEGLNQHQIENKMYRGKLTDPRCAQCVPDRSTNWPIYQQCEKVGKVQTEDGYWWCNSHSPEACAKRKAKRAESDAKWLADFQARVRGPAQMAAMRKALEEIRDGHNDPRTLAKEVLDKFA